MNNIENGQSAAEQGYQMKDIPGWEGLYACTTHGDIWSHRSDKFLSQSKNKRGYLHVTFTKDGKRYDYRVNRLVAMTFLDNPNNLPQVNHIDGNKLNNNVSNLEWCTNEYNMQHAVENNLRPNGESCFLSKLKEEDVKDILKSKFSTSSLAKKFNVNYSTIKSITNRFTWKHVIV